MVSIQDDSGTTYSREWCRYWSDIGLLGAERSGNNFVLIDNVVLNARGLGLALGAAGYAHGNTIIHPKYWGIQVRPRVSYLLFLLS